MLAKIPAPGPQGTEDPEHTLCNVLLANVQNGVIQRPPHEKLETEVVDALVVLQGLVLLRLVPVLDQAVAERKARGGVCGGLVAVVHAAGQVGLHMSDELSLKVLPRFEGLEGVLEPCLALGHRDGSYIVSAGTHAEIRKSLRIEALW